MTPVCCCQAGTLIRGSGSRAFAGAGHRGSLCLGCATTAGGQQTFGINHHACAVGKAGDPPVFWSPDANQGPPYQLSFHRTAVRTTVLLLSCMFIYSVSECTAAGSGRYCSVFTMREWRLREVKDFVQVTELKREGARMHPRLPRKRSLS